MLPACVPRASEATGSDEPDSVAVAIPTAGAAQPLAANPRRPESLGLDPVALGKRIVSSCGTKVCDAEIVAMRDTEQRWLADHPDDWPASARYDEDGTLDKPEDRLAARWLVAVACEGHGPADPRVSPKLVVTDGAIRALAKTVSSARSLRIVGTLAGNTCQSWRRYEGVFADLATEAILGLDHARRCEIAKLAADPLFDAMARLGYLEALVTNDRVELVVYLHPSRKLVTREESCATSVKVPGRARSLAVKIVGSTKAGTKAAHLDLIWNHPIPAAPSSLTFEWQANTTMRMGSCDEPNPPSVCGSASSTHVSAQLEYVRIVVRGESGRFEQADPTIGLRSRGIDEAGTVYTH